MNEYTECPECVMDRIIVPLEKRGSSMICPMCDWTFQKPSLFLRNKT